MDEYSTPRNPYDAVCKVIMGYIFRTSFWDDTFKKQNKLDGGIMIVDPVEKTVAEALDAVGVKYVHEQQNHAQKLDFYLPEYGIFIECKASSTPRTEKQIEGKKVILVQTKEAAECFKLLCSKSTGGIMNNSIVYNALIVAREIILRDLGTEIKEIEEAIEIMGEASKEGGITHLRGVALQPSSANNQAEFEAAIEMFESGIKKLDDAHNDIRAKYPKMFDDVAEQNKQASSVALDCMLAALAESDNKLHETLDKMVTEKVKQQVERVLASRLQRDEA